MACQRPSELAAFQSGGLLTPACLLHSYIQLIRAEAAEFPERLDGQEAVATEPGTRIDEPLESKWAGRVAAISNTARTVCTDKPPSDEIAK